MSIQPDLPDTSLAASQSLHMVCSICTVSLGTTASRPLPCSTRLRAISGLCEWTLGLQARLKLTERRSLPVDLGVARQTKLWNLSIRRTRRRPSMASTRQAEDDRSRRSETSRPHVVALLVFSRSLLYWVETPWCCTMRKPLRAREAICGHLSMGLHVNDSGSIEQWPRIVILAVSRRFGPYGSPYCDLPARSPTWRWEPPRQSKRLMSEKQAASA